MNKNEHATDSAHAETFWDWMRSWRWFIRFLGLGVVILLFYGEENWRGKRAWTRYESQLAAQGEPMSLAALVPPPVADESNFVMTPFWVSARLDNVTPRYQAASKLINTPPTKPKHVSSWVMVPVDLRAWHVAFQRADSDARQEGTKRPGSGPIPAKPLEESAVSTNFTAREAATGVLAGLSECDALFEELRAGSRRPCSRFNLDYAAANPSGILLPHLTQLKGLCQILQLKARAELELGRADEAFDDVSLMLELTDASRREPIIISQLVRIAQLSIAMQPIALGLASHQWSDAQLRALQERLSRFDFCADYRQALQGERVVFGGGMIDYLLKTRGKQGTTGVFGNSGSGSFDPESLILNLAPSGWFYFEKLNYTRLFEENLLPTIDPARHRINPGLSHQAEGRLNSMLSNAPPVLFSKHRLFSALLLPALTRGCEKAAFAQTSVDLAALACALERYRLAHGQFPDSLEALVPGLIPTLPRDIINGEPLHYRRTQDGRFVLYSVGWNETDDGGVLGAGEKENSVDYSTGDWVWQNP
jgi:hypothetical protein